MITFFTLAVIHAQLVRWWFTARRQRYAAERVLAEFQDELNLAKTTEAIA